MVIRSQGIFVNYGNIFLGIVFVIKALSCENRVDCRIKKTCLKRACIKMSKNDVCLQVFFEK